MNSSAWPSTNACVQMRRWICSNAGCAMNAEPLFGSSAKGKAVFVIPSSVRFVNRVRNLLFSSIYVKSRSLAFARDDGLPLGSVCIWEKGARPNRATDAEFNTQRWVRCHRAGQNGARSEPPAACKRHNVNELESFCDKLTWQWVCNHS